MAAIAQPLGADPHLSIASMRNHEMVRVSQSLIRPAVGMWVTFVVDHR